MEVAQIVLLAHVSKRQNVLRHIMKCIPLCPGMKINPQKVYSWAFIFALEVTLFTKPLSISFCIPLQNSMMIFFMESKMVRLFGSLTGKMYSCPLKTWLNKTILKSHKANIYFTLSPLTYFNSTLALGITTRLMLPHHRSNAVAGVTADARVKIVSIKLILGLSCQRLSWKLSNFHVHVYVIPFSVSVWIFEPLSVVDRFPVF